MEASKCFAVILLFYLQAQTVLGANILFFFGFSTYSHRITAWPFIEKLTEQGHNVTFLSLMPNKSPDPRITEIVPNLEMEFDPPDWINMRLEYGRISIESVMLAMPYFGTVLCEVILGDPKVIEWAKISSYDLVVIDFLFNDCGFGFAHKFNSKIIIFGTSTLAGFTSEGQGMNGETNWIPDSSVSFQMPLSFLERVVSTLMPLIYHYSKAWYMYPALETMLKDKLDMPDMPPIEKLEKKAELILLNTHFSEELPRSFPPYVIPVGGMHCKDTPKPLPKAISTFIEKAGTKGFIYVSFGSALQLGVAPAEIQNAFFHAIGNTSLSFLWRWDYGDRPENMPPNVHTEKWMPQQDILSHPNVRAFVTHGGLLGMQEAVYHGVPMIVFPIFAEQDYNAERIQRTERGIQLEIASVTQEKLQKAFHDILNDQRYQRNIKEASKRFKDRPMKPVDTAMWWTEYILRHEDTSFMRPLESANQFWFQRHLLDVWTFIGVVCISIILSVCYTISKLVKIFYFSKQKKGKLTSNVKATKQTMKKKKM